LAVRRKQLEVWLEKYRKSWEQQDSETFANLFAPDARYRETPFLEFVHGPQFRAFWKEIATKQADNRFSYEIVLTARDRAVVHWTATTTWIPTDERRPGDGVFLLRFDDNGQCMELLEWQHWQPAGLAPLRQWGVS
jgi:hypothetical protein